MSQFAPFTGRTHALAAAARASDRFVEFFTAQIRNPHTRRAYARAIMRFFGAHGGGIYRAIRSCRPRSRQKGPMLDNNPWNTANVKAKEAGRNINCSVRGGEPERSNVEAAPKACARQFRYRRVPAGAIVTLIDQCPPSSSR
jgi:hypothetical protein